MSGFRRTLAKDPELDALVMLTVDCRAADEFELFPERERGESNLTKGS